MRNNIKTNLELIYKRLAIINCLIVIILAIPTLFIIHNYKDCGFSIILLYIMLICLGILWSSSIMNKIWKNG